MQYGLPVTTLALCVRMSSVVSSPTTDRPTSLLFLPPSAKHLAEGMARKASIPIAISRERVRGSATYRLIGLYNMACFCPAQGD